MEPTQAISGEPASPALSQGSGTPPPPSPAPPGQAQPVPAAVSGLPATRSLPGIPAPVTSLVGRHAERDGVAEALRTGRLVTLMGPGGVGKTRLALAVAAQLQSQPLFTGRAWWVELAPVARDEM